jgi:hypothetical protein
MYCYQNSEHIICMSKFHIRLCRLHKTPFWINLFLHFEDLCYSSENAKFFIHISTLYSPLVLVCGLQKSFISCSWIVLNYFRPRLIFEYVERLEERRLKKTVGNKYPRVRRDDGKSVKILIDRSTFNVDGASLSRLIGSSGAKFICRKSLTLEHDEYDNLYFWHDGKASQHHFE